MNPITTPSASTTSSTGVVDVPVSGPFSLRATYQVARHDHDAPLRHTSAEIIEDWTGVQARITQLRATSLPPDVVVVDVRGFVILDAPAPAAPFLTIPAPRRRVPDPA